MKTVTEVPLTLENMTPWMHNTIQKKEKKKKENIKQRSIFIRLKTLCRIAFVFLVHKCICKKH